MSKIFLFAGNVADFPVSDYYKQKFLESEKFKDACITFTKALCEGDANMMADLSATLLIAEYLYKNGNTSAPDPAESAEKPSLELH